MRPTDEQFWKKEFVRKNRNCGEKIKWRGKLTAAAFCRRLAGRYGSDGPSIALLTVGGWPVRPTEEQFNWKKKLLEKTGMVGGKENGEANSPSLPSP